MALRSMLYASLCFSLKLSNFLSFQKCVFYVCAYIYMCECAHGTFKPINTWLILYNNKSKILQNAMQILFSVYQFDMLQTLLNFHVLIGALFVLKGKQISI